ncbi:MAG: DoxX family protein [Bacteroidota bacterium]
MEGSLIIMAWMYVFTGVNHFVMPKMYLKITPLWVPKPNLVNHLVGLAEAALGLGLLFGPLRSASATGLVVLLVMIFPANVFHLQKARKITGKWQPALLLRLPIQAVLIWWAWGYV